MQQLGDNGTVRQAIESFIHNAVRQDLIRTVSQVVEEFIATKTDDGLSQVYLDDCTWRLRVFATDFQTPISHVCTRDIVESGWLIDSSAPYRLGFCRIQSFHWRWAHRDSLLHEPVEKLASVL